MRLIASDLGSRAVTVRERLTGVGVRKSRITIAIVTDDFLAIDDVVKNAMKWLYFSHATLQSKMVSI